MNRIGKQKGVFIEQNDYDFIFDRTPRFCIDLLIRDESNNFLLSKRNIEPYKNLWHLPGGRVLFMESINQAIERIAREECGLSVNKAKIIGTTETDDTIEIDGIEHPRHSISIVYEVNSAGGALAGNYQSSALQFFSKPPAINEMHPTHGKFIHSI